MTPPAKKPRPADRSVGEPVGRPVGKPAGELARRPPRRPVRELSEAQCWTLLAGASVGTLALVAPDGPDLYPIDFLVTERTIVFRSAPGEKLVQLTSDPRVALAVEGRDRKGLWSIVVRGTARRLAADDEIEASGVLALRTSIAGTKANFVLITPTRITGRRFSEPD